jgi:hypothetical protein
VVNEALGMAVDDIKAGRRAHDWVDYALDKWDKALLDVLIRAQDDTERVSILQQYSDPELFRQLVGLLMDTAHPEYYRNFIENVRTLLEEASKDAVPVQAG